MAGISAKSGSTLALPSSKSTSKRKVVRVALKKKRKGKKKKGRQSIREMLIAVKKVLHEAQCFFFNWVNIFSVISELLKRRE